MSYGCPLSTYKEGYLRATFSYLNGSLFQTAFIAHSRFVPCHSRWNMFRFKSTHNHSPRLIAIHFDSCSPRTDTDFRIFDTLGRTRIAIIPQPCSARQNNLFSLDLSFGPPSQAMASFRLSPFCVTHRNECHRRGERIRLICFRALRSNLSLRVRKRSAATNGLVPHESTTTTAAFPKLCFGPSNTNKPGKARSLCMGETVFHPPTHRLRCDS